MLSVEAKMTSLVPEGVFRISGRVCMPRVGGWISLILEVGSLF